MLPRAPVNIPLKEVIEQYLMVFLADPCLFQIPDHTYSNERLVFNKHEVIMNEYNNPSFATMIIILDDIPAFAWRSLGQPTLTSVLIRSRMPVPPSARSRLAFLHTNSQLITLPSYTYSYIKFYKIFLTKYSTHKYYQCYVIEFHPNSSAMETNKT
jgi:hypothetical protein